MTIFEKWGEGGVFGPQNALFLDPI